MRIETLPLIVGAVVALFGAFLLYDAWTPDDPMKGVDRRRAPRDERSRGGETAIGFGVLCLAAAMFGRDTWPYSIVSAIAGCALIVVGAWMNRRYIRGRLTRNVDEPASAPPPIPASPSTTPSLSPNPPKPADRSPLRKRLRIR